MQLYLLRHGDAVDGYPDQYRRLSVYGRQQVQSVAHSHRVECEAIEQIVSSPYKRAAEATGIFTRAVNLQHTIDWLDDLTPQGDLRE